MPHQIRVERVDRDELDARRLSVRAEVDHARQVRLVRAGLWRRPQTDDTKRRSV
jgi:hypothetical protein